MFGLVATAEPSDIRLDLGLLLLTIATFYHYTDTVHNR